MRDRKGFLKEHLTDRETYKHRLDACRKCDSYKKTVKVCGECGCLLFVKARSKIATCPKNNW